MLKTKSPSPEDRTYLLPDGRGHCLVAGLAFPKAYTIGRADGCDFQLTGDQHLSREIATIISHDGWRSYSLLLNPNAKSRVFLDGQELDRLQASPWEEPTVVPLPDGSVLALCGAKNAKGAPRRELVFRTAEGVAGDKMLVEESKTSSDEPPPSPPSSSSSGVASTKEEEACCRGCLVEHTAAAATGG